MMMMGASGVLLGTRFYASQECDGAEEAKREIVESVSRFEAGKPAARE